MNRNSIDNKDDVSDTDSKAETISLESDSTDASKSTRSRRVTCVTKVKKDEVLVVYHCSTCKYQNAKWFEFETHCKVMHRIYALFPCTIPDCFKFYISKNGLKGHCTHLHRDQLNCTECSHMATSLESLQDHTLSHHDKKFVCNACKRGFGTKWDVNRHYAKCLKNPQRKITCKQCSVQGKSVDVAGTEEGLVLHLQDEHNLRGDWLCENCHRLSQSEKRLENHLTKCKRGKRVSKALASSTEDDQNVD